MHCGVYVVQSAGGLQSVSALVISHGYNDSISELLLQQCKLCVGYEEVYLPVSYLCLVFLASIFCTGTVVFLDSFHDC